MNINIEKDRVKDILILSLIDSLSEIYSLNLNIDKNIIYNSIVTKLDDFNIIDINKDTLTTQNLKKILVKYITNDITQDLQLYNPIKEISFFGNFNNLDLIGQGGNGWVFKVFNPLDKNSYAIKKIGIKKNYIVALNEVRAMAKLNDKNIVRYYNSWIESKLTKGSFEISNTNLLVDNSSSDKLNLVNYSSDNDWDELNEDNYNKFLFIQMELCKCNLKEYLINSTLSLNEKVSICLQILHGLEYIHSKGYIHRDIKPSNIFLGYDNLIKIGDFGLITDINNNDEDVGTIGYTAPEVLNLQNYDYKADLYSLGIVFLDIFFLIKTDMGKVNLIKEARDNKLHHDNHVIKDIINGLIEINQDIRIDIKKCLHSLNKII